MLRRGTWKKRGGNCSSMCGFATPPAAESTRQQCIAGLQHLGGEQDPHTANSCYLPVRPRSPRLQCGAVNFSPLQNLMCSVPLTRHRWSWVGTTGGTSAQMSPAGKVAHSSAVSFQTLSCHLLLSLSKPHHNRTASQSLPKKTLVRTKVIDCLGQVPLIFIKAIKMLAIPIKQRTRCTTVQKYSDHPESLA